MPKKHLTVVLRTCDRESVHPERGPRYIDAPKSVIVKKCASSLIRSLSRSNHLADIDLRIIDDNSNVETLEFIVNFSLSLGINPVIEVCKEKGHNYSALRQLELCVTLGKEWVYCVEDDYLHFPNAIEQMLLMSDNFVNITGTDIAIRPDDDPFTYSSNNPHSRRPSLILLGNDRHWRTLYNTHYTIFTHVNVFREYKELFASLAKFYKKLSINEDSSINMIWERVPLFSPIPTLALHISQNNEPAFIDYKTLWYNL